jgi:hypothetical protein
MLQISTREPRREPQESAGATQRDKLPRSLTLRHAPPAGSCSSQGLPALRQLSPLHLRRHLRSHAVLTRLCMQTATGQKQEQQHWE